MQDLQKIETPVLLVMVTAHSSYYGRELTPGETKDCQITIGQLQKEIASRTYTVTKHTGTQGE